jgi:hypothetical protein
MKRVLLLQLDGKMPNIALMRVAAHHRERGDSVVLEHAASLGSVERGLWDRWDMIYASLIFQKTKPAAERLLAVYPWAVVGGTGWDVTSKLEDHGITTKRQDYSDYPKWRQSIGFTQRGCRLNCSFCVVPKKEGKVRAEQTIAELWRGEPYPRHLILLDNDFFGNPDWRAIIAEIREGGFKVSFSQGVNARMLTDEAAEAIASVDYRNDAMKRPCIHTAWDSLDDEGPLFRGLRALKRYGVNPDHITVYVLVGYDHEEKKPRPFLVPSDFERWRKLRDFGCRPYPMPFVRTDETRGFQRWIVGAYDKRISWGRWEAAGYEPRKLIPTAAGLFDTLEEPKP